MNIKFDDKCEYSNDYMELAAGEEVIYFSHFHHNQTTSNIALNKLQIKQLVDVLNRWFYTEELA